MPVLAPLFLLGLAAIAVPVLVHLVQREKRDPTAFPSLMFVEQTPAPFSARRHLRDPLLLVLRALALLALVLAFARPVFGRQAQAGEADQRRREIVVLLDRSFSMRVGQRWAVARAAVDSVIGGLAPGDRLTLMPFDRRATAVTEATGDLKQLRAGLDTVSLTDESTRLAPAIALAQQRLASSDAPRKAVVLISDFQRTSWDITDDVQLAAGIELVPVDVASVAPVSDRSVRSVEVRPTGSGATQQVIVSARIVNAGDAVRAVTARLELAGRVVEERRVDLPRDGGATVNFAAIAVPPEPVPARVVLDADAVPGDDAHHFLLQQSPALRTLLIAGRPSQYLTQALSIGSAPRFDVITRTPSGVRAADLIGRRLVILADGAFPTGLGVASLLRFVQDGGGLVVALGEPASARSWTGPASALLPGTIRSATDPRGDGAVLGSLDSQHPALSLLTGERAGDLLAARFLRYRAIDTTAGVLARFDDGSAALTEHAVRRGRVLTFASSLDGSWNDLPRQPAFLPFIQQLARYAAAWRDAPGALRIGASVQPADLAGAAGAGQKRWVVLGPSGARTQVGGADTPAALELREAGVYELRPGGSPGARPVLLAANIDPAELDFTSFDVTQLTSALADPARRGSADAVAAEPESFADREARQHTWWYLMAAAVLLLAAESIIARRSVTPATTLQ